MEVQTPLQDVDRVRDELPDAGRSSFVLEHRVMHRMNCLHLSTHLSAFAQVLCETRSSLCSPDVAGVAVRPPSLFPCHFAVTVRSPSFLLRSLAVPKPESWIEREREHTRCLHHATHGVALRARPKTEGARPWEVPPQRLRQASPR